VTRAAALAALLLVAACGVKAPPRPPSKADLTAPPRPEPGEPRGGERAPAEPTACDACANTPLPPKSP